MPGDTSLPKQGQASPEGVGSAGLTGVSGSGSLGGTEKRQSVVNKHREHLEQLRIDRTGPAERSSGRWIGVVLIVVLIAMGSYVVYTMRGTGVMGVKTALARESTAGERSTVLNASGYVTARRQATVSSKVTGKVLEVLVEEGMRVEEEQVLATLDSSNVNSNFRLAEAELLASRARVEETRVRVGEALREWRRVSALRSDRIASESDFDRADSERKSWEARIQREEADTVVAEKQLALWQQQLDDNVIRAPFAGVVVSKNAQPGEMISPVSAGGGFTRTGICTIVDMQSLEIEVDVGESYINRVIGGQSVVAVLDAYPDWSIPSDVIAIIPTADRQKATVKVRVGFEKLDARILPQMGVKVRFQDSAPQGEVRSRVIVPSSAVLQRAGNDMVWVVRNGRAERRAVKVSESNAGEVEVLAGLAGGERVVLNPPAELKDGDAVVEGKR
ncbi:MAG: efflux RND transporter periplasmic adaptor subunit [Verrucomicrobia bacterium]|nr:efflux RND transporter periplasmic adaptor subunit [Verrucomicrobiota bacterium]